MNWAATESENEQMTKLHLIKDQLKKAGHVVVLTGAGMSQESGLPTYRATEDGLWSQHVISEVATEDGLWSQHVISEVATAEALRRDPKKVWQWLQSLAQSVAGAAPNAGHAALAQLQQQCKVTVVTQNVDDLHERAGNTEVIHLHGNAFAYRCTDCDRPMTVPTPLPSNWEILRQQVRCAYCNGHIRHDVILFNEMLDHTGIKVGCHQPVHTSAITTAERLQQYRPESACIGFCSHLRQSRLPDGSKLSLLLGSSTLPR